MGPPGFSPATGGISPSLAKKKRGRPRKYGPDVVVASGGGGGGGRILSQLPLSSASSPTSGGYEKFGEGAGSGGEFQTEKKRKKRMSSSEKLNMTLGDQIISGGSFTPHMVTVNPGEDVTSKIISLTKCGPRAICVLSALGIISHVTLRQASSPGGTTVTYEGRFEILSLSGSFTPGDVEGLSSKEGGMSIALSSPDGRVVGGLLGGLLTAASIVQVVVASFVPDLGTPIVPKPKKQKNIIMQDPNMEQNLHEGGNDDSTPAPNFHRSSMPTVHDWSGTPMNLNNEQRQRQESPVVGNDDSTPAPNFHHENRSSVHDWSRSSMNLNNEQRQRQESPMMENDDSTPATNFHHENRTVHHDWRRTSMNLNEQRQRQESPVGVNDGTTPATNFQHERTSVSSVQDWRRAVTDMNVSFRED
ncbi:hypothetical protein L2E82_45679 [Cichorium intybus]|uniref:Uncharacterized protein n=1 Tax=Cichorium intybus TaxID=13427 RepID=A0ACB8ZUM7_CICIN|nr:hypothetical protein L2E82_45679 [Cichorium intybus]